MDLPSAVLHGLVQLGLPGELDGAELDSAFVDLVSAVRMAVPSYRGLMITIVDGDQPVSLVDLSIEDRPIVTSLRLPFGRLDHGSRSAGRIVFWAAQPGAFVDLAADLCCALQPPTGDHRREPPVTNARADHGTAREPLGVEDGDGDASIVLDADLPLRDPTPGLSGIDQLSTVNRAVGMLIGQGHNPDQAIRLIHREAASAGIAPHVYAAQLLYR